jgi:hypothetical protein
MYENVQAPMMEAAAGGNTPSPSSTNHNPFKSLLQGGSASGHLVKVRITAAPCPTCIHPFSALGNRSF